jgi:hypothetical protein
MVSNEPIILSDEGAAFRRLKIRCYRWIIVSDRVGIIQAYVARGLGVFISLIAGEKAPTAIMLIIGRDRQSSCMAINET